MKFSIVNYSSEEITHKSTMINDMSIEIELFLKDKNYGVEIDVLYIGLICVHPQFEQFFKYSEKYIKSKKMLEYSMKLNFEDFKDASEQVAKEMIAINILNSIENVIDNFKLNLFNISLYKKDLRLLFNNKKWINE